MMQTLTHMKIIKEYARLAGKWLLYLHWDLDHGIDEVLKAAPYLTHFDYYHFIFDGSVVIEFDTEEEMREKFWQTVGDDGPTKLNNYNGPARVYALTISNDGEYLNENT